jgi:hypothetical protein
MFDDEAHDHDAWSATSMAVWSALGRLRAALGRPASRGSGGRP